MAKHPFKDNALVLIVVEGGMAEVRTVPPGVTVVVKDYDCEGDGGEAKDSDGEFNYEIRNGNDDDPDKAAEAEAARLVARERRITL